jgi:replication initiation protein RepC
MTTTLSAPPSGRRRITEAQLKATAGLTGIYAAVEKNEVLGAFKKAAPALGTSRRLVDFIDLLMSRTFPADWTGEWRPVVWPSNDWLADRLGLEISRVKELIRAAIDAGLMLPVDSGTRKRYGKRAKPGGRILYAYGFDLSPLAERLPAFQLAAAEHEARRQEGLALRRDISHLRAAILGLTDYAEAEELPGQDWPARALAARDVATKARYLRDPFALAPIATRLVAMREEIEAIVEASVSVDNNPREPENRPHNTTTNQLNIGKPIATAAMPAQERESGGSRGDKTPGQGGGINPLRGFPMTPAVALQIAPAFRGLVNSPRPSWQEISEAAFIVRGSLGISQHAYGQACAVLGRYEAATAIAAISAKSDMGLVRSPGGLLRHMVDAHLGGTLRLDRTLFGLVDKAGGLPGRKVTSGPRTVFTHKPGLRH